MALADYRKGELRFRALANADPAEAERLLALAQQAVDQRWKTYEEMATRGRGRLPGRRAGTSDLMDLSTSYMGLELRNPLVASASPLSLHGRRACSGSRTPASARSCCTRCSRSSCAEEAARNVELVDGPSESFAEALDYFPAVAKEDRAARAPT